MRKHFKKKKCESSFSKQSTCVLATALHRTTPFRCLFWNTLSHLVRRQTFEQEASAQNGAKKPTKKTRSDTMKPCWGRGQIQYSCKTGDPLSLSWTSNCGKLYNMDVHYLQDCANYIFLYTCLFLRIHVWASVYCFPASLFIFAFLPLRSKCGLLISVCSHPPTPPTDGAFCLFREKETFPFLCSVLHRL